MSVSMRRTAWGRGGMLAEVSEVKGLNLLSLIKRKLYSSRYVSIGLRQCRVSRGRKSVTNPGGIRIAIGTLGLFSPDKTPEIRDIGAVFKGLQALGCVQLYYGPLDWETTPPHR